MKIWLLGERREKSDAKLTKIDWLKVMEKLISYQADDLPENITPEMISRAWRRIVREKLEEKALDGIRRTHIKGQLTLEDIVASRIAVDVGDDRLVPHETRIKALEILHSQTGKIA